MRSILRLVVPACLVAVVLVASGCNILSIPFYIFGPEEKIAPPMPLADKNKEVKVLIWTWSDRNAKAFVDNFMRHVSEQLSWKFTAHPPRIAPGMGDSQLQ